MEDTKKCIVDKISRSPIGLSKRKIELIVDDVAKDVEERSDTNESDRHRD